MIRKLREIEEKYRALETDMTSPVLLSDPARYLAISREYKRLSPIVLKYREYTACLSGMQEAELLLSDPEFSAMAEEEYRHLKAAAAEAEELLKEMLLPRDPNDGKNLIMEIRACAGGEEAALFAYDLYRMYTMYADAAGFRTEVLSKNETDLGGFREITFQLLGDGSYSRFKFESGVHRVQRIPVTDSHGKIQTSTVSVAVLPEVEEVEIDIRPTDLEITTCKSSGAGGQHVNKTESAVRILHKPTGLVVECQEERSQYNNKEKALRLLRAKLWQEENERQNAAIASTRKSQLGSGDRSEKIRTYNFPQGRITDHRIGMSIYHLDSFLNGDIGEMLLALRRAEIAEKLKGETSFGDDNP